MESSDGLEAGTPGARLRAAREALGISPREMADRLNWVSTHVAVIEEDRFEELRGAAFVKGYLRAYAKALNLDEDEIVAAYAAMLPEQEASPAPAPAPTPVAAPGQKTGWSVVFGVVVSIVIIGGIWWNQQAAAPVKPAAEAQQSAPARSTPAAAAVREPAPEQESEPESESAPEPGRPDTSAGLVSEAPAQAGSSSGDVAAEAVTDGSAPVPEVVADATVSAGEPLESAATEGDGLLEFEFTDDCWLEVRDGDDQLIYAQLHGPGDRLALEGKPPFRILAGNAAALTLSFRGEPVPVVTRPGRDSARFTVGES